MTVCPQCGASIPPDATPGGLCPQCLLKLALLEDIGEAPADPDTEPSSGTSDNGHASAGEQFGPYQTIRILGEGGMGIVYLAEQHEPIHRQVALKVIKLGMNTREVIARFESERQTLALMDHPNIARVFDAGASEQGQPYFVMEYVSGIPITEYCDKNRLSNRQRMELFLQVCQAVQHAHQKGVIHRDIKPSNVLVGERDGQPFPQVIDFGIAKATDQRLAEYTAFTQFGQLVGTPEYMSPEQAEVGGRNVDTTTDVYSLGVLLYQLLVGALPFEGTRLREAGFLELLRIIREEDPPTPSNRLAGLTNAAVVAANRHTDPPAMRRQLAGDLNWIVLKAIEKDKNRRYASASDFAGDVRRYLTDQPVVARPPSASYHLRKFVRRHRRLVASASAVFVALVGGVIASTRQAVRAMRAEAAAVVERDSALAADQANTKAMNRVLSSLLNQIPAIVETKFAQKLLEQLAYEGPSTDELLAQAATERAVSSAYRDLGQWANAQRHLEQALRLWQSAPKDSLSKPLSTLGFRAENTPAALSTMTELASVYEAQGDFSNAEPLLKNVFETERRLLGDWHPETLHYEMNLAHFYHFQWRLKEAESLFREVLEILRNHNYHGYELEKLGGSGVLLLSAVLQEQGKFAQAEPLLNQMLKGQGKYAPDEPRLDKGDESNEYLLMKQAYNANALDLMGRLRLLQHRYPEAEKLLREAREQHSRIYGDDWVMHAIESLLGKSLAAQRRYSEAEQLLISGYEGMLHLRDAKVSYISYLQPIYRVGLNRAGERLVELYRDWGKPQKVTQWQARIKEK